MPFNAPFETFEFSYVQRNPDLVKSHVDTYYKDQQTGLTWFAPQDTISDGQSIPRALWSVFGYPLQGSAIRAAFLHDVGYKGGFREKADVDLMFYHALIEDNDPHPYIKYLGVKLFGFYTWNGYRQKK
jgi:hypothetical protein